MTNSVVYLILLFQLLTAIRTNGQEEITEVHLTSHKNVNELQFRVFGRHRRFTLQPAPVFKRGFRSLTTDGQSLKPVEDVKIRSDSFYTLNGGKGSVHVERDNGNTLVHGIIDDNLTIEPHKSGKNRHLVRRTTETKVAQTDYIRPKNKRSKKHQRPVRALPVDYIRANLAKSKDNSNHNRLETRDATAVPEEVTVEVLVVFDYRNSKRLNFDHDKIVKYLGIFWNSVSQRYSSASKPKISVAVSGLIIIKSSQDEPFITNNIVRGTQTDAQKVLYSFKDWLEKQTDLPNHDVALLQTSTNGGSSSNGQFTDTLTGIAFIGTTCYANGYDSGFFEDTAPAFTGVITAAHELAHTLNVPHDGHEAAANCPASDGYIMGPASYGANKWHFSSCSLQIMRDYVRSDEGECMRNKPEKNPKVPLLKQLPVLAAGSLDEQCRIRTGDDSFEFYGSITEDICSKLWCAQKGSGHSTTNGGAVEGTPCAYQKVCLNGVCSPNGIPSLDKQCRSKYGSGSYAQNKDDANVCTNLKCANQASSIAAQDGSSCGNSGVCISRRCLYQVPSLNDQCKRNFGDAFTPSIRGDQSEVCSELWCSQDQHRLTSRGGANENSICGSGKVCRSGSCVAN